jgi:hypothetical protein
MAHENDGFGAILAGIFYGRECADDALVVCDLLVAVEGNVEVDLVSALLVFVLKAN